VLLFLQAAAASAAAICIICSVHLHLLLLRTLPSSGSSSPSSSYHSKKRHGLRLSLKFLQPQNLQHAHLSICSTHAWRAAEASMDSSKGCCVACVCCDKCQLLCKGRKAWCCIICNTRVDCTCCLGGTTLQGYCFLPRTHSCCVLHFIIVGQAIMCCCSHTTFKPSAKHAQHRYHMARAAAKGSTDQASRWL
jgi:hypothetical protein